MERKGAIGVAAVLVFLVCLAGCQSAFRGPNRSTVATNLAERFGQTLPCPNAPDELTLPPGALLEDGVTEDEAIAIALWNNAAFQELLVNLGIARGDLIEAGLLPNPEFIHLFQVPDKPFRYAFELPIEALWLRPIRVRIAAREADRTADLLAQAGLELIRDVRQAYADVLLAKERVRVAEEGVKLRGRVAELADNRLKAGDISPQEAATAQIDALQAQQDLARLQFDVPVTIERLRNLLGIGPLREPLHLDPASPPTYGEFDVDELTEEAMANRPDALAAAEAVAAAEARLRLARVGWFRLLGIADATSGIRTGHEFGPALRFTVPLFNWNQGGIARADAELERAMRNQTTVAYQIILDVQQAYLQYQQAAAELKVVTDKIRPEVLAQITRSQRAYEEGNVAIFIVLEATRQLLDNELRQAQLQADLRRTWAQLERSIGRRLAPPPTATFFPRPPSGAARGSKFDPHTLPPPRPEPGQLEDLPAPRDRRMP